MRNNQISISISIEYQRISRGISISYDKIFKEISIIIELMDSRRKIHLK